MSINQKYGLDNVHTCNKSSEISRGPEGLKQSASYRFTKLTSCATSRTFLYSTVVSDLPPAGSVSVALSLLLCLLFLVFGRRTGTARTSGSPSRPTLYYIYFFACLPIFLFQRWQGPGLNWPKTWLYTRLVTWPTLSAMSSSLTRIGPKRQNLHTFSHEIGRRVAMTFLA